MKKFFLTLFLMCLAVPAFAGGQIHDLTLENIEEKLAYQNLLNKGNWDPQVTKEEPAATWFSLNESMNFIAGHEHTSKKINRIQFFVMMDKNISDKDERIMQFINDAWIGALTAASLCISKFDSNKSMVKKYHENISMDNAALFDGKRGVFTAGGYRFTAMFIDGVYTIWAEKK